MIYNAVVAVGNRTKEGLSRSPNSVFVNPLAQSNRARYFASLTVYVSTRCEVPTLSKDKITLERIQSFESQCLD